MLLEILKQVQDDIFAIFQLVNALVLINFKDSTTSLMATVLQIIIQQQLRTIDFRVEIDYLSYRAKAKRS
jgi:hypothetical protein